MKTALLSVSDKTGIVEFAQQLIRLGYRLLSTGGTAQLLSQSGVDVTEVALYTGFDEILDGRVKTLHPKIHAGLLARRASTEHMNALAKRGIDPIDILAVNLYPFEQTVAKPNCPFEEAIEQIDIGGPAMLRAAAKNHESVTAVVEPKDYDRVIKEIDDKGRISSTLRFELASKVFSHTARYDGAISNYLTGLDHNAIPQQFPSILNRQWVKVQDLRYGENPHQSAAFYREQHVGTGLLASLEQLQGKELSYNNIADADAAWETVREFDKPACVIVKHANPCGVACADTALNSYELALATDKTSAFGGIVAFNRRIDAQCARRVSSLFVEVVIAPEFDAEAREIFSAKPNIRLLKIDLGTNHNQHDIKRVGGGLLVQTPDVTQALSNDLRIVTERQPTPAQMADIHFAFKVAKFVKSNAIIFVRNGQTLGIGAGQMSRIDSARIAALKAKEAGLDLNNSVVASDAFFPFRDGLDTVCDVGATCIVQPGGSVRDEEVIAAANERGVAMVFTGIRHFRH